MPDRKKCFVLMPFADTYREVYTEIYRPVCAANELDIWRVDEVSRPGSITRDIVEGILDADLIIADLTSKNPNVFYELGIAHAVGNKTIMTAQSSTDVPFDIANFRVIFYEQSITGSKKLKEDLDKAIKELLVALDRTNNPFQEVVSLRSPLGHRRRVPLIKFMNVGRLPKPIREWLASKNVIYAEDIARLDLNELVNTPGIGQESLRKFFMAVLEHDLYPNGEELQRVILERRIKIQREAWER